MFCILCYVLCLKHVVHVKFFSLQYHPVVQPPSVVPPKPVNRIVNLCSVSSGNFINGRNPKHTGIQVMLSKKGPKNLHRYIEWEFIPAAGNTFNIRSISSGNYLNGRNPEHLGIQVMLTNVNKPQKFDPITNKYFQWRLIPCGGKFAIQSVSSGNYLDGRNPEHRGIKLFLTNRPPQNDKYLQWTIIDVKPLAPIKTRPVFVKPKPIRIVSLGSVSSGNYIDGRNPEHTGIKVFLTNRPPQNDKYLQWKIIPCPNGTVNLQSVSSGNYLNGRNPEHLGIQVMLTNVNKPRKFNPRTNKYFQWRLIKCGAKFAIRSVSSGNYLDGRNPNHTGIKLFLTNRPPQNDKYLQWNITDIVTPTTKPAIMPPPTTKPAIMPLPAPSGPPPGGYPIVGPGGEAPQPPVCPVPVMPVAPVPQPMPMPVPQPAPSGGYATGLIMPPPGSMTKPAIVGPGGVNPQTKPATEPGTLVIGPGGLNLPEPVILGPGGINPNIIQTNIQTQTNVTIQTQTNISYQTQTIEIKPDDPVFKPQIAIDFSKPDSGKNVPHEYIGGATIKPDAPDGCPFALRIEKDGQYVKIPDFNIAPGKMPNCTLVIAIYIQSIVAGSMGWVISSGYDRAIVMHDSRFNPTPPPVGKWIQVVVTYTQGKPSYFYVDGQKAPNSHVDQPGNGSPDLYIGRPAQYGNHWSDCWIKEVMCYNFALTEIQIKILFMLFKWTSTMTYLIKPAIVGPGGDVDSDSDSDDDSLGCLDDNGEIKFGDSDSDSDSDTDSDSDDDDLDESDVSSSLLFSIFSFSKSFLS